MCRDIGGECVTERDGYYMVSALCMTFGVVLLVTFIIPNARKLQGWCTIFSSCSNADDVLRSSSDICMAGENELKGRRC